MTISLIISILCFGFCLTGFFYLRWYIKQKIAASSLLSEYREEVYRLIAEIDAATDRDSLLVEERIKTLKKYIEDTDRRISVYMREVQRSHSGEAIYASLGKGIRAALDSRPAAAITEVTTAAAKIAAAEAAGAAPSATETKPEASSGKSRIKPAAKKRLTDKKTGKKPQAEQAKPKIRVQIAEMAARGNSPQEIASALNLSLAEVELALSLLGV